MNEPLTLEAFASQLSEASDDTGQAPEAPEAEAPEQIEGEEAAQAPADPEQSEDDDAPAAEDEGQAPAAPSDDAEVEWKTQAGESHKATLKELKDGYLRQADYTQKTQAIAAEREKAQQVVLQLFESAEQLAVKKGQLHLAVEQLKPYQGVDWDSLRIQNKEAFDEHFPQFQLLRDRAQSLANAVRSDESQINAIRQQEAAEASRAASDRLSKAIPGFGEKHLKAMNLHMLGKGLSENDLPDVVARLGKRLAPAVLEAIHEAAQWRELQAKKPEVTQRAKAIPPKSTQKAAPARPTSQQEQVARIAASNKPMSRDTFASLLAQTRKK